MSKVGLSIQSLYNYYGIHLTYGEIIVTSNEENGGNKNADIK